MMSEKIKSPRAPANIWRTGTLVFVTTFLFYLALQYENYGIYFARHRTAFYPMFSDLSRILLSQVQNLIVSGLVTALFVAASKTVFGRVFAVSVYVFVLTYMLFNNIFYTIFFDHYQVGFIEGAETSLETLKDSIVGEFGVAFSANAIVALWLACLVGAQILRRQEKGEPWPKFYFKNGRVPYVYTAVYSIICCGMLIGRGDLYNISAHPLISVTASLFRAAPQANMAQAATLNYDPYPLKFGLPSNVNGFPAGWRDTPKRWSTDPKKPNIVFFVLESVGSKQILPDGKLDPKTTPFLASLSQNQTIFTHIYDNFPGTVRSHVPILTGGYTITWGSVYEEYKQSFMGPTIPGELSKAGYKTGLFSAQFMDTENLGIVYENLPWDESFTPEDGTDDFRKSNKLNSWGVDERRVMDKAIEWASKQSGPFLLEYMTNGTHHPYSIPKDYPALVPAGTGDGPVDRKARYTNALNFTDSVIKQLVDQLKAKGQLDNTIIFICGDHGEAFGEWHPTNMTHKNYIYDENIRNFLLVIDPRKKDGPTTVPILGAVGDIAPTMVNTVAPAKRDFLGQDLFDPNYKERIAYFHKNAQPERWGLRDGKWKFIAKKVAPFEPELFDLENDPHELVNLADKNLEKITEYQALVKQWYLKINKDYGDRLRGFRKTAGVALAIDDLSTPGPKKLAFGSLKGGKKKDFHEIKTVNPEEDMVAWTFGVAFPDDTTVFYEWTSPAGKKREITFKFDKDWTSAHVFHKSPGPMEEGKWKVRLHANGKDLISGDFEVSKNAPLYNRRDY